MKIGVDLDHTVYGFPEFFRAFIPAMVAAGHEVYCTSNHLRSVWHDEDCPRLKRLGINTDLISPSLLSGDPRPGKPNVSADRNHKAWMADQCDYVFDDLGEKLQRLTKTPVFGVPKKLARDR